MSVLRLCSYNLGVNRTDKRKPSQIADVLSRMHKDGVDIVCFQETRPYGEQEYFLHDGIENALHNSPYSFHTFGNCSIGGKEIASPQGVRSFPNLTMSKYSWRAFARVSCRHKDHRVLVFNAHTRAEVERKGGVNHKYMFLKGCGVILHQL